MNGMRAGSRVALLAGVMFLIGGVGPAWGQCEIATLTAGDGGTAFGTAVAISGNYAIVGDRLNGEAGSNAGAAYIFRRLPTGWVEEAKIMAADAQAGDEFGRSVGISGDTVVVGAWHGDGMATNSGSAYVFRRSGTVWTQEAKLIAADGASNDVFGLASAVSGDYAVVGAYGNDDAGSASGSAYVFKRTGAAWAQDAKLTAVDAAAGDQFGLAVSVSGDTVLVGAVFDDDAGSGSGSAYVFRTDGVTWAHEAKLTAVDATASGRFGRSVAIDVDTAVIGADGAHQAAYVFTRSGTTWSQQAKLVGAGGPGLGAFGQSVSVIGDEAAVGNPADSDLGTFSGAAYLFTRTGVTWSQTAKLTAHDGGPFASLGDSVAISAEFVMATAADSVYVFQTFLGSDCNHNGVEDLCDIVVGTSSDCNGNLAPDECDVRRVVPVLGSDFEPGLPGTWSASGLWHVTGQCAVADACNPTQWAYFGDDGTCTFDLGAVSGALTTPSVPLVSQATTVWLTYCSMYDGDRGAAPFGFDSAWVNVNGTIVDDVGPSAVPGVWEERSVNLDAFIGQTVGLSWNFDSIDAISNAGLGWQVDRIELVLEVVDNDCNTNGVPDECDPDCNTNGVADDCDIAAGTSPDCNTNGIPDECDPDFDGDGLIDDCDPDIDNDGVPNETDVCDFTPPGAIIEPDGGVLGDLDGDCDVDLVDYAIMQMRFTGPNP